MNIQINVYGSPWVTNTAEEAITFANIAMARGHNIRRVFFYFDGVYHGLKTQSPATDEYDLLDAWQSLSDKGLDLFLCIAAATNRGVLSSTDALPNSEQINTVHSCFEVTGLGQWASGFHDVDKIVTFK